MSDLKAESLLFDVFGRMMQAQRTDGGWQPFLVGAEGKKQPEEKKGVGNLYLDILQYAEYRGVILSIRYCENEGRRRRNG
jgi:hypothetical protein